MHSGLATHLDQHGVVTTRTALRFVSPGVPRAATSRGDLVPVWRGVLARPDDAGLLLTRLTALSVLTGHPVTACLTSAAELYGFAVDPTPDAHVLARPEGGLGSRPGLVVHQRRGAPVVGRSSLRLTEPAWTAVEVARTLRPSRALATLDAALHLGRCTRPELDVALRLQTGRRGTLTVARVLPWADALAESPMESETRHALLDGGLPPPVLQHPVRDDSGRVVHRLDLAWPAVMLAVEFDGVAFHSSAGSLRRDRARAGWLLERGWTVLAVTSQDVRRDREVFLGRVAHLLAR